MTKFKSIAEWPEEAHIVGNRTEDSHESHKAALDACWRLAVDGFAGAGEIYPTKTYVEEVEV